MTEFTESKILTTEDTYLIAYLKMKGFPIKPWVCREMPYRVAFDVDGETTEAVESYYSGELVSIRDYVAALKDVRRSMFEFKKGQSERGRK